MKIWTTLFFGFFLFSCCKHNVPKQITASKILQIELGMSKNEVIQILKEPVRKYSKNSQGNTTFQFTKKYDCNYPMLWVHFDSIGVREVYAKYYDWMDDRGIYGLSKNRETGNKLRWGEEGLKEYFRE